MSLPGLTVIFFYLNIIGIIFLIWQKGYLGNGIYVV